jgi:hypothetical protein
MSAIPTRGEKHTMPQTKQKPAAATEAQPIQPEPPKPTAKELREAETQCQFKALEGFARMFHEEISLHDFQTLKTFKLIMDRNAGCNTPVENFLVDLIHLYEIRDANGEGLTLEDIQSEMQQDLIDNDALSGAIKDAHFIASRYPLPEPSGEPALEK